MSERTRPASCDHQTFRQIVEANLPLAAGRMWDRAEQFSKLRHLAKAKRRARTARRCGEYKARLLGRLLRVAPDLVKLIPATDSDRLFSVWFRRRGRLHIPPRYIYELVGVG